MKLSFLFITFTLLVIACGKNNSTGKNYCPRGPYEVNRCMRMYVANYGYDYAREMCITRYGQTVACY